MTGPYLSAPCAMADDMGLTDQCDRCTNEDCPHTCHRPAPVFIGRPDGPPIVPVPQPGTPRPCDRCGRVTSEWIPLPRDDDHGPLLVAWCKDEHACNQARRKHDRPTRVRIERAP